MWKWLHPYAKAQATYELCNKLIPWLGITGCLGVLIGSVWGLAFAPTDYQQGDSFRIIYLHVPSAMLSMSVYFSMACAAFIGIVWQIKTAEIAVYAIAPVGAVFTAIALLTGAAWGKPMWGTWWVWDARITSELILLFLYVGVIALYSSFEDKTNGARAAGILALVGVVNLPIIHYSVEWWNTLHQGATITRFDKPLIDSSMLWPLLINLLAYGLLIGAIICARLKNELLVRDSHRPWVKSMLDIETD